MKTSDFYYDLPEELIAQTPVEPRDSSRLFAYNRATDTICHEHFYDITKHLRPGDVLVINNTRVLPARLFGRKREGGGQVEFLLLNRVSADIWEIIMRPGKRLHIGDHVDFSDTLSAEILEKQPDGLTKVSFEYQGVFETVLDELGQMPLPPYIHVPLADKTRYQTVYAKENGSAAAPTAGLHFTPELLQKIADMGVSIQTVLLHIGLGTFRPVKSDNIEEHNMHTEFYSVTPEAADAINAARERGGRIIAIGTTSVRTLESAAKDGKVLAGSGNTSIFIYPGYKYQCVDALVTNFHLPESTLVMLVSAFIGREKTLELYKTAVEERYRFFSFGDAMLIE